MEKYAFFLPQFHEIEENNEWWGEGFTEWNNVKKAVSFRKGQVQPQAPLDSNYYNLLDKQTVEWQTELMHKYHIDGFIYYHYFFNGKLLMEKPAENLLQWKDINQRFFFCWGNHSFIKTQNRKKTVLLEQTYGTEEVWEQHFQYLLPFFKDSRYIKKNNKPLFMIFKTEFDCKKAYFDYFDHRCREEGFDGLCLIETCCGIDWPNEYERICNGVNNCTDYIYIREPDVSRFRYKKKISHTPEKIVRKIMRGLNYYHLIERPEVFSGNEFVKLKLNGEPTGKKIIHGFCFAWDNTPRHRGNGYIITSVTKDVFFEYMNSIKTEEYLFINAWNEWAEGMMLEPTEENKYKYLEWISEWTVLNEV